MQSVPVVPKGPNGSQIPEKEPKKIRIPKDVPITKTDLTNQTTQTLALRLTLMATETRTIRETSASEIPITTKEESCSVERGPEAHALGRMGPML